MKTHTCTLGYYGQPPVGIHPAWDGELFTENAARETVEMLERDRVQSPARLIETPYGPCRAKKAYLDGGRICWELEQVEERKAIGGKER